ncbi:GAF and ANTAR domain-containing protein [Nocardioides nitrophenolicus]|uniref:GAF and ANTAR domain-containing protein n=1 Tax=Nocardioides nitrophenolicus TaxID=60489 RepID=UPI00195D7B98|nr:GAF and ANTAR domain-containing protein [Nocardioides nitrophenolicus]MBM7516374.1 transcriptional regulator with GAF, ATPase, and Fis domain [Nocardioides nitrophenolicus]
MTASIPLDGAASAFWSFAQRLYAGNSFPEVYEALCATALAVVPGCDHACITTVQAGQRPVLAATTDAIARTVDALEWEVGEGPCVDAIRTQRFERDPDIANDAVWPRLAERVLRQTPVRGMIGYRVIIGERKVGALNLFSDTPGAFTRESADLGAIIASFASVAVAAANEREAADSLRAGLASNREIGKAIGLLMATYDVSDTEAFALLRDTSNRLNVRLATIAGQVVDGHRPKQ